MSRGSHLFGQSMVIIAWHQTFYLQPYSILKNDFLRTSCVMFGRVGNMLMNVLLHWVAVASFPSEALYF